MGDLLFYLGFGVSSNFQDLMTQFVFPDILRVTQCPGNMEMSAVNWALHYSSLVWLMNLLFVLELNNTIVMMVVTVALCSPMGWIPNMGVNSFISRLQEGKYR